MAKGGSRQGAGRKRGVPNKKTVRQVEAIKAARELLDDVIPDAFKGDAHDLLMAIYKDPRNDMHTRMDAAKASLPYEKSRLASIEHTGKDGGPIETKSTDSRDISRAILAIFREGQTE